jgi:Tfp pilus assembly protein FimT
MSQADRIPVNRVRDRTNDRAFTRVGLLVAVAIVAILAGMLYRPNIRAVTETGDANRVMGNRGGYGSPS